MQRKFKYKRILITLIIIIFLLFLSKYVSYAQKGAIYNVVIEDEDKEAIIEDDYAKLRAVPIPTHHTNKYDLIIDKNSGIFNYKNSLIKYITHSDKSFVNIFYNNKDRLVNIIEHDSFYKVNEYDILHDAYDFNVVDYVGSFIIDKNNHKIGKAQKYYKTIDLNMTNSDIYTHYSDIIININNEISKIDGRNVDNSKSNDYNISLLTDSEIIDKDGNIYDRAYIVSGTYTESLLGKQYDFTSVIAYTDKAFENGKIIFHSNIQLGHYIDNINEEDSIFKTIINKLNKYQIKEHVLDL